MKHSLLLALPLLLAPAIAHAQSTPASSSPEPQVLAVQPMMAQPAPVLVQPGPAAPGAMPWRRQPRTRPYRGGAIPEGATLERHYNRPLLLGSVIPLAVLEGINVIWAMVACPPGASDTSCQSNTAWLYLPIVGPFFTAASGNSSFGGRNLAILDGAVQTALAAMVVAAVLTPHRVLVWHDEDTTASARSSHRSVEWAVVPTAGRNTVGATLSVTTF